MDRITANQLLQANKKGQTMKTIKTLTPYQMIVNLSKKKSINEAIKGSQNQKEYYNQPAVLTGQNIEIMKTISKIICVVSLSFLTCTNVIAQRKVAAVLNIDTKGVIQDPESMGYMVRLELEKTQVYSVIDKYDIADILESNNMDISGCYGKTCLTKVGKILQADKMVTGNVERFGEKIVITLRLIDISTGTTESSDATEYLNLQPEIQNMVEISVKNLLKIENDPNLVNLLIDYDQPVTSPKTSLKLNGPRMGVAYISGDAGKRLTAPKSEGGYNMYPITTQFGYQWETQYLSAGDFQALFEFVGMIGGLESGQIIPSLALMNGFRGNKSGWEFAFGPVFKIVRTTEGYFENSRADGSKGNGKWHRSREWGVDSINWMDGSSENLMDNPNEIMILPDSRGSTKLSANLVLAAGKTFKSGYLNVPINFYVIPKKNATIYGISMGFNINQRKRVQ